MPEDWVYVFQTPRQNPCPFNVIQIEQNIIRDWATFLKEKYKSKCPFKTRPVREAMVMKEDTMFKYRNNFNGAWTSVSLHRSPNVIEYINRHSQGENEFYWPDQAYNGM